LQSLFRTLQSSIRLLGFFLSFTQTLGDFMHRLGDITRSIGAENDFKK
jgi:hypothetical protein